MDEELPTSKLGTKQHWDEVYERENKVFQDVGDEGEIWFGEESVEKMRAWAAEYLPPSPTPVRILECGSGNGTLLLSFLTSPAPSPSRPFHLTGIDYSAGAIDLARGVEASRRAVLVQHAPEEEDEVVNECIIDWRVGDLLRDETDEQWDLVLDKGTFDALCLSSDPLDGDEEGRLPSTVYPEKVAGLVREGGFFLITSCNFTEAEILKRWTLPELGFIHHSTLPHPKFSFGGRSGSVVCTLAFLKTSAIPKDMPNSISESVAANGISNGHLEDDLYICIDCGGTKTDIAIASGSKGIIARAIGRTSNMAEVGLHLSYEIICSTTLDAISNLPSAYRPSTPSVSGRGPKCPIHFADVWVGISGCDTALDQKRMSKLLSPFFGLESVLVMNDAHLLGGALLTHQCPWGVAVIAGTGSVVISLEVDENNAVVQTGRRGGTGYLLGDDGSAFDVGRCGIRKAIDDFDAGEEQAGGLAQDIRDHFGVIETGDVLAKVYDLDPQLSPADATNVRKLRISSLSLPIMKHFSAATPDPLAVRAVYMAAGLLVDSILSLVRQLVKQRGCELREAALVMGGGVIRQESYRAVVRELLADGGVVFGTESVARDVAGEAVMGLVARARAKEDLADGGENGYR